MAKFDARVSGNEAALSAPETMKRRENEMCRKLMLALAAICIMTVSSSVSFAAPLSETAKDRQKQVKQPIPNVNKVVQRCPDLAAKSIDFSIISKTSQFEGTVRITGIIKNVGTKDYKSGPNQQSMMLYESTRMVAQKPFQNLAVGQEETISYERNWNASSPSEGEFPPEYKLMISFDPDINMDANPDNDECNTANNQKTRSGAGINGLFSSAPKKLKVPMEKK